MRLFLAVLVVFATVTGISQQTKESYEAALVFYGAAFFLCILCYLISKEPPS